MTTRTAALRLLTATLLTAALALSGCEEPEGDGPAGGADITTPDAPGGSGTDATTATDPGTATPDVPAAVDAGAADPGPGQEDAATSDPGGATDAGSADVGQPDSGSAADAAVTDAGDGSCAGDADCDEGTWCRPTEQEGVLSCVPYVGAGDTCGGYVLPWTYERCEPSLACVHPEPTGDVPGVCATCGYQGKPYAAGDSFDAADGCNTCTCLEDGSVACTEMACLGCASDADCGAEAWCRQTEDGAMACTPYVGAGDSCGGYTLPWYYEKCAKGLTCVGNPMIADLPGKCGACWYEGDVYQAGDTFEAADGCNTCTCSEEGVVGCTKKACPPLCPDGSDPVQCFVDPCSVSSCGVAGATCMADYCGGCHAVWTTADGETVCDGCETNDDCPMTEWCRQLEAGGNACVPYVGAGETCGGFTLPWYYEQCEPGLSCLSNPMIADLPGKCGACWYEGDVYQAGDVFDAGDGCNSCTCSDGGAVMCTKKACPATCPDGSDPVQCFVDPCSFAKCGVAGATCTPDYCGGCYAVWTTPDGQQVCNGSGGCESNADCPDTEWCRQLEAGGNACVPYVGAGETCGGFTLPWYYEQCEPGLTCVSNPMIADLPGKCGACWYEGAVYQAGDTFAAVDGCNSCVCDEDGGVSCTEMACEGKCPDGSDPVQCFVDPCSVSTCDVEGATCEANYCGGCHAIWTLPDGTEVCTQ